MPRIPLSLRLPNAPLGFVGREDEAASLARAIAASPVSLVWGVGGLGKTALALHVLHATFQEQVPYTLYVRLHPNDAIDQVLLDVGRAIAAADHVDSIDWHAVQKDPDLRIATAIDLAERAELPSDQKSFAHPWFVVLDDAHHADESRCREVLDRLARYARRSRFIALGRRDLGLAPSVAEVIALGAMSAEGLAAIAARTPKVGQARAIDAAVAAAAGSPWRLRQILAGARAGLEPGGDELLATVSPEAAELLRTLAALELDVSAEALAGTGHLPDAGELEGLVRRGLVERTAGGLRIHDVARGYLHATTPPEARAAVEARLAGWLAGIEGVDAGMERLRLLLASGDRVEVAAFLAREGDRLCDAGCALRLAKLLARIEDPSLDAFRLRCAAETDDAEAMRAARLPTEPSLHDRVRWARVLSARGELAAATEVGLAALADATAQGSAAIAFEAGEAAARAELNGGRLREARRTLARLEPATPEQAATRDVGLAVVHTFLDEAEQALARVEEIEGRLDALSKRAQDEVRHGVGFVYFSLGHLRRAERAIEAGPKEAYVSASARRLFLRGGLALSRGALDAAGAIIDRLTVLTAGSAGLGLYAELMAMKLRLRRGEIEAARDALVELRDRAAPLGRPDIARHAVTELLLLSVETGDVDVAQASPESVGAPSRPGDRWDAELRLHEWLAALHRGGVEPAEVLRELDLREASFRHVELCIVGRLVRSRAALLTDDVASALVAARDAAALARDEGYTPLEGAARVASLEALVAADASREIVAAELSALVATAATTEARSPTAHARLFTAALRDGGPDLDALEELALDRRSPATARRARALLGESSAMDPFDARLTAGIARRAGFVITVLSGPAPDEDAGPRWTLDERRAKVLLPGREVDLGARALLLRILQVIAEGGGAATKEALVQEAWGERVYHPLRHDGRLHTAVRKLRKEIEDDPGAPRRLLTTEVGYAFGDAPVRRITRIGSRG